MINYFDCFVKVNKNKKNMKMLKFEDSFEKELEEHVLEEGKIMTAFNTGMAIYMTKKLLTPWKSWDAYKLGLIDEKGARTKKEVKSQQEKEALSLINKFIISIRRIFRFFMSEGMLKLLVGMYITKNLLKK